MQCGIGRTTSNLKGTGEPPQKSLEIAVNMDNHKV